VADTSDLRDAVSLAGRGVASTTTAIRDIHLAIAGRAFTVTGPAAAPVQLLHDGISRGVYAAVAGGSRAAAGVTAVAMAARAAVDPSYQPLADRTRAGAVISALNGAWGDLLTAYAPALALPMTIRRSSRDVPVTGAALAAAFPDATGDVVVFVHGLCESDQSWRMGAARQFGDRHSTLGSRLQADTGMTPVYLRYNSGLHVSDNGEQLDRLLSELVEQWPVEVTRLTLVGHSMGGLVIRSACHLGAERAARWATIVKRIVYLGSPHLGAPLEVGASRAAAALRRLPETRPLGNALASRSVGIKDLRFGDIAADDWTVLEDLDARRDEPSACRPLLPSAEHYYIGATLGRRHDTVAARIIGDALVPWHSASGTGRTRQLGLEVDRGRHLAGLHHFDLLNHPRVYAVLRDWLLS